MPALVFRIRYLAADFTLKLCRDSHNHPVGKSQSLIDIQCALDLFVQHRIGKAKSIASAAIYRIRLLLVYRPHQDGMTECRKV